MRRGELSNVSAPEVWVLASVVFKELEPNLREKAARKLAKARVLQGIKSAQRLLNRRRYEVPDRVRDWLASISFDTRPVLLWIGKVGIAQEHWPPELGKYLLYKTFQEAVGAVRRSPRAAEIVVGNRRLLTDGVHLFDASSKRYGSKQWILRGAR